MTLKSILVYTDILTNRLRNIPTQDLNALQLNFNESKSYSRNVINSPFDELPQYIINGKPINSTNYHKDFGI